MRRGFKRIERIVFDASSYTPLLTIHIKSRLFIQNIIAYYTFAAFWATMHPICSLQCTTECVCKGGRGTRDRRFSLDVNYWEERKIHRSSASYFSLSLFFIFLSFFRFVTPAGLMHSLIITTIFGTVFIVKRFDIRSGHSYAIFSVIDRCFSNYFHDCWIFD